MTRHRWGELYGDDIESLAAHTNWQSLSSTNTHHDEETDRSGGKTLNSPEGALTKLDVTAEIEQHCLILRTVQRLWYPADMWSTLLEEGVVCRPLIYCQHSNWSSGFSLVVFPEDLRFDNDSTEIHHYFKQYSDGLLSKTIPGPRNYRRFRTIRRGHCMRCDTSYHITVWFHCHNGIEIALQTVTNLGACEYPADYTWRRAVLLPSTLRPQSLKTQGRIHFSIYSRYLPKYPMPHVTSEICCNSPKHAQSSAFEDGEQAKDKAQAKVYQHGFRVITDQEAQAAAPVATPPGPKIMGPKAKESWYLKTARFVLGKIDDFDKKQTWYSPRRTYFYF